MPLNGTERLTIWPRDGFGRERNRQRDAGELLDQALPYIMPNSFRLLDNVTLIDSQGLAFPHQPLPIHHHVLYVGRLAIVHKGRDHPQGRHQVGPT
jgi:hypothetical protein